MTSSLQEDDREIQEEGLDSLTVDELRQACRWGACPMSAACWFALGLLFLLLKESTEAQCLGYGGA